MAHDLQAPLRTIKVLSQIILEDYASDLPVTARNYLKRSISTTNRLNTLITDLLAYSRVGCGEIQLQKVDLAYIVTEVIGDLRSLIDETQTRIFLEQLSFKVKGHQSVLIQVILNLITNAIKFVAPNTQPQIRIWAELRQRWVRLWIEDNGIGISQEERHKIFEVFIRLHGHNSYDGTGIGLALVKRGIERLNGHVGVESQLGQGSRFWIELPEFSQ
jgi:signal transduction histidine kinase